jgi:ABC-2 type transport system permease protein
MRRTWQIACKELLENRRDGLAALFTIILPVIFTIFLGLIIGGAATETFPLSVADSDDSTASQALVQRLRDSPLLRIENSDPGKIDAAVKDQKAAAGLIIPQGFGLGLEAGGDSAVLTLVRVETSSGAQTVQQAVNTVVAQFNASLLAARTAAEQVAQATGTSQDRALLAEATTLAEAQLASPVVIATLVDAGTLSDGTHAQGFDQSSTGGLVNWVLFGIMGVAGMTVWERKRGLLRRLNGAGVRAPEIVGGKMIAMVIITMLQQLLLVIVGKFALGVDYFNSPLALFMIMISLSGLAASFGLLISVLFRSEQAVIATTVISAQLLAAVGGAWFPLEITNAGFSRFAHVLPSAWIMDALHGITLKGWGAGDVLIPLAVVWAWILVVFGLAVWRYRPE